MPSLKEITKEHLEENDYDGLCGDYCGCSLDDLMDCDEPSADCEGGYKIPRNPADCPANGDCGYHIGWVGVDSKCIIKLVNDEEFKVKIFQKDEKFMTARTEDGSKNFHMTHSEFHKLIVGYWDDDQEV